MNTSHVLKGAFLLSVAALVTKLLSAVYRIPFQNMAGDLGFYVYQQVYPFFGMMTILALYGFPVVLSRQIAEKKAQGKDEEVNELLSYTFLGLSLVSIVICALFIVFSRQLALFIGDESLTDVIRLVGFGFLFLPVLSIFRGAGQGINHMTPTALSQVSEQFVRVLAILVLTYVLASRGYDAYVIGEGAIYASLLGSVVGCAFLLVLANKKDMRFHTQLSFKKFFRHQAVFLKQSLFICLNSLILLLFQVVDVMTVVRSLQATSMSDVAIYTAKGVYDRGQPLIQLGTILITSIALAVVPLLSNALATKRYKDARRYRDVMMRLTILLGGGATIGLFLLMDSINTMLFTNQAGTEVLRVFVLSIFPCSIYLAGAAIIQGYGRIHIPVYAIVAGIGTKIIGNVMFITVMKSTMGAALANVLAFTVMMGIVLYSLKKIDQRLFVQKQSYVILLIVLLSMGVLVLGVKAGMNQWLSLPSQRSVHAIQALTLAGIGAGYVGVAVLFSNIFTVREWASAPKLAALRKQVIQKFINK
ncbi:putative polysaccharide biosynthesis protein [Shouchella miscanthi]|uniref:putative polysaccharide biosynthesis protein n=1 Tax=Shouchella miscanthi TaxID=2598861 RepID=UPI0011A44D5F|nr:polysaccharide biosynthesis protein [Shouchella miscanthi]